MRIAVYRRAVVNAPLSGSRSRVSWPPGGGTDPQWRASSPSLAEYRGWIEANAFSALLYDGGLIQCTFEFDGADLIKHRLAYFPCPFDLEDMLDSEPILDLLDIYEDGGTETVRLGGPVRFDFDVEAGSESRPSSHVTMINSSCRIPAVGPLSLGHFIRFVFHHFYPVLWEVHPFLREWPQESGSRTITNAQEIGVHASWWAS